MLADYAQIMLKACLFASIMLNAFAWLLCLKLCWYDRHRPSSSTVCVYINCSMIRGNRFSRSYHALIIVTVTTLFPLIFMSESFHIQNR